MPNVRGRTKKASDDKARDSTPRATGKRKAVATPGPHEIESAEKVPVPKFTVLDDEDEDEEIEQSPLQSKHAVAESTPLPVRLQRRALDPLPGPSKPPKRQLYSPLPPSSPPSMSSDDLEYENAPPVRVRAPPTPDPSEPGDENVVELPNKENEFTETEEEDNVLPVPALDFAAELAPSEESSQDDPFGFTALERRLKSQRAARRHSFEPLPEAQLLGKGKEPMRPRAPLGELSFDRGGASTSTLKDRHPTPYHESDDLEDMYLDPNELALPEPTDDEEDEHAHIRPSTGLEGLEAEMDEEEQAELARELQKRIKEKGKAKEKAKEQEKEEVKEQPKPVERESSTDSMGDALRTPQPKHVANIYPLRSPFSSVEGTPCDRSLPDSPLSSPSPTKPMAVLHTLPVSSARKGMLSPAKKSVGPRPLVELPGAKRRRITLGKENSLVFESEKSEQEEKVAAAKVLERLMDKMPSVRRSARNATGAGAATTGTSAFPRSSSVFKSSPVVKRGRGRPRKQAATSTTAAATLDSTPRAIPETSEYDAPESSPMVTRTRKRRAAAAASSPIVEVKEPAAKKAKTKTKTSSTAKPTARRGRPPGSTNARSSATTKPASRRGKPTSKGKGKGKADVHDDDEDSVRVYLTV